MNNQPFPTLRQALGITRVEVGDHRQSGTDDTLPGVNFTVHLDQAGPSSLTCEVLVVWDDIDHPNDDIGYGPCVQSLVIDGHKVTDRRFFNLNDHMQLAGMSVLISSYPDEHGQLGKDNDYIVLAPDSPLHEGAVVDILKVALKERFDAFLDQGVVRVQAEEEE